MKIKLYIAVLAAVFALGAQAQTVRPMTSRVMFNHLDVDILPGERWWGGSVGRGGEMPFKRGMKLDLATQGANNQVVGLLVSNKGRYVWGARPFAFEMDAQQLKIVSASETPTLETAGTTLREAYRAACARHFPPSGTLPDPLFFEKPQWNTWIELQYNQNQADIMKYAHGIVENGLPPGVLMIDDSWQKAFGTWAFQPDRFPDPRGMVDELHAMGFKVMLWVCPFVSPDTPEYRDLAARKLLVLNREGTRPAVIEWWNGQSASYDMTNPAAREHFTAQLRGLQREFGIDGFKFDGGDNYFYTNVESFQPDALGTDHSRGWALVGLDFPFNEYRACWQMGGQPLVQRLGDKNASWGDLAKLVPEMAVAGLLGYAYTCPDMIGGGQIASFRGGQKIDQELVVRSAQVHAMMPMMQFSVAPWRILDTAHLGAVKQAAALHTRMAPYIMECAREASASGEPIVRLMEYAFPGEGFEDCRDQYMLGQRYLVAPVMTAASSVGSSAGSGAASTSAVATRTVKLPKGHWRDDLGDIHRGGRTISVTAPLHRIPYFEKMK